MPTSNAYNRVKGALFEFEVECLLNKSGYKIIPPDGENVREGHLLGRGAWHQIDAFGCYSYGVPCLYPIRVICEAKNYAKEAGLPVVRNFVGAFIDIAENYFVEPGGASTGQILTKRYTDAGAIFSARGFTVPAQDYAYAQGVFLVSYKDNPVLAPLLNVSDMLLRSINISVAAKKVSEFRKGLRMKTEDPSTNLQPDPEFKSTGFEDAFTKYLETMNKIGTSYLATASETYPVHILSENDIPWELFDKTDEASCKIHYHERSQNCLEIVLEDAKQSRFYVSIPGEIFVNYRERMLELKAKFFSHVDFPVVQNGKRRILRFNLDTEWIEKLKRRRPRSNMEW